MPVEVTTAHSTPIQLGPDGMAKGVSTNVAPSRLTGVLRRLDSSPRPRHIHAEAHAPPSRPHHFGHLLGAPVLEHQMTSVGTQWFDGSAGPWSVDCPAQVCRTSLTDLFPDGGIGGGRSDMAGDTTTDFDLDAWVRESRAAQGLPPIIEDDTIITRVLILAGLLGHPATPPRSAPGGRSVSHPAEAAPLPERAQP